MNRFFVFLILVSGLAFSSPAVAGEELLVNSSFEEQGESADFAKGWSRWGNWINRETGWNPVLDGKCLLGYHHWQIEKDETSGFYQDIENVQPGRMCTFSIHANADAIAEGQQGPVSVEIRLETTVYDEQSVVISQRYEVSDLAGGTEWSRLCVRAKTPNNRLRALVVITPAKGKVLRAGALKFDKASVVLD